VSAKPARPLEPRRKSAHIVVACLIVWGSDEILCKAGKWKEFEPYQNGSHEAGKGLQSRHQKSCSPDYPEAGLGQREMTRASPDYDLRVFINCPFDDDYVPLFRAAVFAVFDCGFIPRCALEVSDSGQVRIDKIVKIIKECRLGLHDISRTELDLVNGLPRFNMPLELGIFLGAQRFGNGHHKRKNCLVLDMDRFRYQKFISDIAGQDVAAHDGVVTTLIKRIRDWLRATSNGAHLPGGAAITRRLEAFTAVLPDLCAQVPLDIEELTFSDYANLVSEWLRQSEPGAV
jgi:hypothetical protein